MIVTLVYGTRCRMGFLALTFRLDFGFSLFIFFLLSMVLFFFL